MTSTPHDNPPGPWRSRFARLHPKAYLWMHAVGGALATIVLTWIFLAIADEIPEQSYLVGLDMMVGRWIEAHGTEWGEKIFFLVSYLGAPMLAVVVIGVLLWFAWHRDWHRALAVALTTGGGIVLSNVLKLVFHRGRPETATEFITRHTWSFPSGHSMNSTITYGFLTVLLLDHVTERRKRTAIVVGAAILIGAIGFSRVYLGVHYMSDVVGGWIAGGAWLIVCAIGYRFTQERRRRVEADLA
jgi:Membrane-associated phospholipid phosphatase